MRLLKYVALLLAIGNSVYMVSQTQKTTRVSPQAVCTYITARMTADVSQVPTLCSGGQHLPDYLDIKIFATTNVFQSGLRRAWSSALFQTLEDLEKETTLHGACSIASKCIVDISDSNMAESALHYRLIFDGTVAEAGPEFSDPWYISWWNGLIFGKEADHSQSKENAESLGNVACDAYKKESATWSYAFNKPLPSCSIMLATDEAIVLVIDYDDFMDAWDEVNAETAMISIGKALDNTAYKGAVIMRSPWTKKDDGSQIRMYKIYDLGGLELAYEEYQSGTRDEASAGTLLSGYYRSVGQTESNHLDTEAIPQYIVKESPSGDDTVLIDTSDGAEWKTTAASLAGCPFAVGSSVSTFKGEKLIMFGDIGYKRCQVDVSFVRGW